MAPSVRAWATPFAVLVCMVSPWLNPVSSGPQPAAWPLIVSWLCIGGLLVCGRRSADPGLVRAGWISAGLASTFIGLCQYFGLDSAFAPWMNQAGAGEAFAHLRQRNQFATLTNMALAALVWQSVAATAGADRRLAGGRARWLPVAAAIALAVGNAASSSRTGLVELLLVAGLAALWGHWRDGEVRRLLASALLAYFGAAVLLPLAIGLDPASHGAFARLARGDVVCASRGTLWSNMLTLVAQRPWTGWGWGEVSYAHYLTLYPGPRFCDILDNAHNLPLHLAVTLGLPAAALACGGVAWLVVRARPWKTVDPDRQLAWTVLALIGLHSLLEYPLWYGPFQMGCGLCLILLWRRGPARPGVAMAVRLAGATAVVAFCLYAAWDYHRVGQLYLPTEGRSPAYREQTLTKVRDSWLFRRQVQFAELTTTDLTPANARPMHALAGELLHFSPEPRVIDKLLDSARLLGREDELRFHLPRYAAAFPDACRHWLARHR